MMTNIAKGYSRRQNSAPHTQTSKNKSKYARPTATAAMSCAIKATNPCPFHNGTERRVGTNAKQSINNIVDDNNSNKYAAMLECERALVEGMPRVLALWPNVKSFHILSKHQQHNCCSTRHRQSSTIKITTTNRVIYVCTMKISLKFLSVSLNASNISRHFACVAVISTNGFLIPQTNTWRRQLASIWQHPSWLARFIVLLDP